LIAFKEGAERGRLRGLRDWTDVALWLHELDRVKVDVVAAGTRITVDVGERRDLAKELLRSGRYQEATEQYLWLWSNIPTVATHLADVRLSFIIKEIDSLVRACPAAEEQFIAIRDRTALIADANPTSTDSRGDWVALNSILGDDERTLSWFDRVKGDQGSATLLLSIRHLLIEPLRLRSRWANLGRLVVDPLSELALAHSVVVNPIPVQIPAKAAKVLGGDPQAKVVEILANQFRGEAADLVTCLRAAGRNREALDVKNEALRLDPSPEMISILEQGPERYD